MNSAPFAPHRRFASSSPQPFLGGGEIRGEILGQGWFGVRVEGEG